MFLESDDAVPRSDVEDDKLNFRDNLQLAINHSNRSRVNVIEKHLEVYLESKYVYPYLLVIII